MSLKTMVPFFLLLLFTFCSPKRLIVKPGIEVLLEKKIDLISGKNVGLITNPTGVTRALRSTIDALHEHPAVQLQALYGPEHGVRGDIEGGYKVPLYIDEQTGIQPVSQSQPETHVLSLARQYPGIAKYH